MVNVLDGKEVKKKKKEKKKAQWTKVVSATTVTPSKLTQELEEEARESEELPTVPVPGLGGGVQVRPVTTVHEEMFELE